MEWVLTNEKQNQKLVESKKILNQVLDEIDFEYDNYGPIRNAVELINKAINYEKYLTE